MNWVSSRALTGAALITVTLLGPPAVAQTTQQVAWCEGKGGATLDQQISGCTAMIESGKFSGANLAVPFNNRGDAYIWKGNYDRAIADLNEAIRLNPKSSSAYNSRAVGYKAKGDYDRAVADLNEVIRLKPKTADYFFNRGVVYGAKGDNDRAIADYNETIRLNPKFAMAFYNRGLVKQKKGDAAGGGADIAKARAIQPGIGQ